MTDIAELRRLEAEVEQKIIAKHLCNLMDDEWRLGRKLYMDTAKEIISDIALPELLAKAEAHDALAAENERLREFAAWVDMWISNPASSYSVMALDGLFGMARERIGDLPPHGGVDVG